jgi:hypothetical protein
MKRVFRIAATRSIGLQDGMPRCGKGSTPLLQLGSVEYCKSGISPHTIKLKLDIWFAIITASLHLHIYH